MSSNPTRLRVLALYKELHRLGRDYPDPSYDFNGRMRRLFESEIPVRTALRLLTAPKENRNLTEKDEIERAIKLGEFIKNGTRHANVRPFPGYSWPLTETLALYSLRKYRHLKRMYPPTSLTDP